MSESAIVTAADYADTPEGWAQRWSIEFSHAREYLKDWRKAGRKIVNTFLDHGDIESEGKTRVNLFTSSTQTLRALLYAKIPKAEVQRRNADPNEKVGRCAATMLQRLLNTDIERDSDPFKEALKLALNDRLLTGIGMLRLHYVADFRKEQVPPKTAPVIDELTGMQALHPDTGEPMEEEIAPGYEQNVKEYEDVLIDYVHWEDMLWSAGARVFSEVRWWAFKAQMTKDEFDKRFPAHAGQVPLGKSRFDDESDDDSKKQDPWSRVTVWEIWDKERRKTVWYVEGYGKILEEKDDPLGLDGFWPFPQPLMANLTSKEFIPRPDYVLAQDLYEEVNSLSTRITLLEKAIRVAGVYDSSSAAIQNLVTESDQNALYPVDNWAMFAEKGGVKGAVDWLPLDQIVQALDKLREMRQELIGLLFQVTGMSDVLRGQASGQATATEQAIKAKFASVRVEEFQTEFARFASDAQRIKAEIISKLFDDDTIIQRSGIEFTVDAPLAEEAVALLKDQFVSYRIEVKPEAVAMSDYAQMKQERVEIMQSLAQFLTAILPVAQGAPPMLPFLMEILRWMFAGFRGGSTMEGILEQAIQAANQMVQQAMNQPKPEDPAVVREKIKTEALQQKTQSDMALNKAKVQGQMAVTQAKTQANMINAQTQMQKSEHDAQMSARQMMLDLQRQALGLDQPQGGSDGAAERGDQ